MSVQSACLSMNIPYELYTHTLTGWATRHWFLCLRSEVNSEGMIQEVELARTMSSLAN